MNLSLLLNIIFILIIVILFVCFCLMINSPSKFDQFKRQHKNKSVDNNINNLTVSLIEDLVSPSSSLESSSSSSSIKYNENNNTNNKTKRNLFLNSDNDTDELIHMTNIRILCQNCFTSNRSCDGNYCQSSLLPSTPPSSCFINSKQNNKSVAICSIVHSFNDNVFTFNDECFRIVSKNIHNYFDTHDYESRMSVVRIMHVKKSMIFTFVQFYQPKKVFNNDAYMSIIRALNTLKMYHPSEEYMIVGTFNVNDYESVFEHHLPKHYFIAKTSNIKLIYNNNDDQSTIILTDTYFQSCIISKRIYSHIKYTLEPYKIPTNNAIKLLLRVYLINDKNEYDNNNSDFIIPSNDILKFQHVIEEEENEENENEENNNYKNENINQIKYFSKSIHENDGNIMQKGKLLLKQPREREKKKEKLDEPLKISLFEPSAPSLDSSIQDIPTFYDLNKELENLK